MRNFLILCWVLSVHAYEIKTLSEHPRIYYVEDFLTEKECEHLKEKAKPYLRRSTVLGKHENVVDSRRSSEGMFFQSSPPDPVLKAVENKVFELTQIPIENGEALQVLHYGIGAEYQPHYDYFTASQPGGRETLLRGGQRVATVIMYLNTPEEGGETIFPLAEVSVHPKTGAAVLFYNVTPDGKDDPQTLHGGAPVIRGEKWIATKWLRQGVFR